MATWYAKSAGDWFAANAWNSTAAGDGTDATAPLTATDDANLNGKAMTTTTGSTITQATILGSTGTLTPTGTLTINGNVTHSGTATTGFLILGADTNVTINGCVTESNNGYAIVGSSNATLTISNGTGYACNLTSGGRVISWGATGTLNITGIARQGSWNVTIYVNSSCTINWTGDAETIITSGSVLQTVTGTITLNYNGKPIGLGSAPILWSSPGTFNWVGTHTITAGTYARIRCTSNTNLNMGTASTALVLTIAGQLCVDFASTGTCSTTYLTLTRSSASAGIVLLGVSTGVPSSGPTLPDITNVNNTTTYGYQLGLTGVLTTPSINTVLSPYTYGANLGLTGVVTLPSISSVIYNQTYGDNVSLTGIYHTPISSNVLYGTYFGANNNSSGVCVLPSINDVRNGVFFGPYE